MKLPTFQNGFVILPLLILLLTIFVAIGVGLLFTNKQPSPLSNTPTSTPKPEESYFQQFLSGYCERRNPNSAGIAIDPKELPVDIDQSIIKIDKATVLCWGGPGKAYIEILLPDGNGINIYDSNSQEAGHGGVSWLRLPSDAFIKKGNIQIAYYENSGEGPAYVGGDTTIVGRGEKEIHLDNSQTIYANTNEWLIKENDPRLTSIIKKHAEPVQDPSETAYVLNYDKFEEDIYETFFKDLSKLGNSEKEGIATIEKILQAISAK